MRWSSVRDEHLTAFINAEVANVLIERLNGLIENTDIHFDIETLMDRGVECSETTEKHPTIQVRTQNDVAELSVLGLINGLCGALPVGPKKGSGYITAVYDKYGRLLRFERTDLQG